MKSVAHPSRATLSVAHPSRVGGKKTDSYCQSIPLSFDMRKLQHYDSLGSVRFVTFTCYHWHPYLTTHFAREAILKGLEHLRTKREVRILGWVLMPEHVHLVLHPPDSIKLGPVIGMLKGWTAKQTLARREVDAEVLLRASGRPAIWKRRCHDHNYRTVDAVRQRIDYCHKNPVRRGLVYDPSQWLWSSYNWYRGEGDIVLEIDGLEL